MKRISIKDKIVSKGINKVFILSFFIAAALLPRLILVVSSSAGLTGDEVTYNELASSIFKGEGFSIRGIPSTVLPPLYPYFLAFIYKLSGCSSVFFSIRFAQAFLGAAACILVYLIANKLVCQKAAIVSFWLTVLNPAMIKCCERVRSECLFIFLLLIAIYISAAVYKKEKKIIPLSILLGLIFGLLSLTRGIFVLFPVFFIACLFFIKNKSGLIKGSLITVLFFSLTLAPWSIRNWRLLHAFVPVSTQSGLALYSSFNPKDGKIYGLNARDKITEEADKLESEVAKSKFLVSQTIQLIRQNPFRIFRLELLKCLYFWVPLDWEVMGEGRYNFIYGFLFPFFIAGFILSLRRFRDYLAIYLPVIYFQTMILIFYGSPRFRLPIEPCLSIFASIGIMRFISYFPKKIYNYSFLVFYLLLNLFIFILHK